MTRTTLFNSCISSLRLSTSIRACTRTSSFRQSYSTQAPPSSGPKTKALKPVVLTLLAIGGLGAGVAIGEWRHSGDASTAINSSEDPDAPAFSTFALESRQPISPTVSIFTFKSTKPALASTYYDSLFNSSIFAVDVAQPQIQIVREYTPLPPALDPATGGPLVKNEHAELHLLVRKEFRGEVSSYIHGLPEGTEIRLQRPRAQVSLDNIGASREVKNLVMVVGGTGITAALQAIHALLEVRGHSRSRITGAYADDRPYIHIMWANRRREDCLGGVSDMQASSGSWWNLGGLLGGPGVDRVKETELGVSPVIDEIRRLKGVHGEHLKVDYFVDEEGTFVTKDAVEKVLASKPDGKSYIAVTGPEGFMTHLAGEKRVFKNKITPKPSTGLLAGLKQQNWELMVLG